MAPSGGVAKCLGGRFKLLEPPVGLAPGALGCATTAKSCGGQGASIILLIKPLLRPYMHNAASPPGSEFVAFTSF